MTDRPTDDRCDVFRSGTRCTGHMHHSGPHRYPDRPTDDLPDDVVDDWITDVDATIHRLIGDDGDNDDTNDWVQDIANALWTDVGSQDAAHIQKLEALGNALADAADALDIRPADAAPVDAAIAAWENR